MDHAYYVIAIARGIARGAEARRAIRRLQPFTGGGLWR